MRMNPRCVAALAFLISLSYPSRSAYWKWRALHKHCGSKDCLSSITNGPLGLPVNSDTNMGWCSLFPGDYCEHSPANPRRWALHTRKLAPHRYDAGDKEERQLRRNARQLC